MVPPGRFGRWKGELRMKKLLTRLLPIVLVFSMFAGCGSGAKSPLDPAKPLTITVWTYYNGAQLTAFNNLVDTFNSTAGKEQGIFVEASSQGSVNDLENNVLDAAHGKVGAAKIPNIFAAYADTAYAVDQMGLVADLRPYLTDEEVALYVDSYIEEGSFDGDGSIKIFPVAKSVELFLLNKTDWDLFSEATGATYDDFSTIEGLTATAKAYYEWTDSLTATPNDGRAFFGRDAMANYFLIGAKQLGVEIFATEDGKLQLDFDHDTVRKLWDNYYIPFINGYFAASGRFRSDDVKTGNVLSFVGSSSGATFFPTEVIVSDTESYPIEMEVFQAPQFADGEAYAVQQGAGMVVTSGTEAEVYASVQFLKWFTQDERNIEFSVGSGYLPVTKTANHTESIHTYISDITPVMDNILTKAVETVEQNTLYTPHAFETGTTARSILEYSMSDLAVADRAAVVENLNSGMSLEEATAQFVTDEYFEAWYASALEQLEALAG